MHADWTLRSGICGRRQLRLFCGELVFERLPLALFALRHPELIGLTPTVGRINDDVAVVIAHLVGSVDSLGLRVSPGAPSTGRSEGSTRSAWGSALSLAITTRFPSAVDG
jgi:hypothetical protein